MGFDCLMTSYGKWRKNNRFGYRSQKDLANVRALFAWARHIMP